MGMPVSPDYLFTVLSKRGLCINFPSITEEKRRKSVTILREASDYNGVVHPVYALKDVGRIQTYSPNVAAHCRMTDFKARPGLYMLQECPAKLEAFLCVESLGDLDLAKNLAETTEKLGEFLLRSFDYPVSIKASQRAKKVFYYGLYRGCSEDEVSGPGELHPEVHYPSWRQMAGRWPKIANHGLEARKSATTITMAKIGQVTLSVACEYEALFPGTLAGIIVDTLVIEANPKDVPDIREVLTLQYRKALSPYNIVMSGSLSNPTVEYKSKLRVILDDGE